MRGAQGAQTHPRKREGVPYKEEEGKGVAWEGGGEVKP
jgi:hypothetical protein